MKDFQKIFRSTLEQLQVYFSPDYQIKTSQNLLPENETIKTFKAQ